LQIFRIGVRLSPALRAPRVPIRELPMPKPKQGYAIAVAALGLLPYVAAAHHFMDDALPRTLMQGLLSGLGHPLIGPDHAAFIVAAGFFLARVPRGMWGVFAMVAGSLVGAALHLWGIDLPGGEAGIALSVILVGGIVMARWRIGLPWFAAGLVLAGMLHGHAYAESIFGAEPSPLGAYLIGFSLTQFGVASAAYLVHRRIMTFHAGWSGPVAKGVGAATGVIGVVFLVMGIGR
jgi:urease accessory protein